MRLPLILITIVLLLGAAVDFTFTDVAAALTATARGSVADDLSCGPPQYLRPGLS